MDEPTPKQARLELLETIINRGSYSLYIDPTKSSISGTVTGRLYRPAPAPQTAPTRLKTPSDAQVNTMATAAPARTFPKGHIGTVERLRKFCPTPNHYAYVVMNHTQLWHFSLTRIIEKTGQLDFSIRQIHQGGSEGSWVSYNSISPSTMGLSKNGPSISPGSITIFSLRKYAEQYIESKGS